MIKILTIGAGVIGTTYSWQLHKAGCITTHYVRKHKIEYYKKFGILIRCQDLRKRNSTVVEETYNPNFVEDFVDTDGYDYILVSVNSNQLSDLLPILKAKSGKSTIVFLQNMRIGDDELIGKQLDKTKYIIAYPFKVGGGSLDEPTGLMINCTIFGFFLTNTVIGEVDGIKSERVKNFYQILKRANMNPSIIKDIIPYIRTHYVWAACGVSAYMKAGNYIRYCERDIIKESYLAMREGWEICVKQGINPRKVSPNKYFYLPLFLLVPVTRWLYKQKGMREGMEGHMKHSPDEMKDMYFTLLAQGEKYGINMSIYKGYQQYVESY